MKNQIELKIEYKKVDDLLPYARNARTHSEEQITQLASSIKEFGFNNPVAIDSDNMILCGHGRVMAAKKLGLDVVPTVSLSHLSDIQKKAYILADNKMALNSDWDNELLKLELQELKLEGLDLDLTGFSDTDLDFLNEEEENTDLDVLDDFSTTYNITIECANLEEAEELKSKLRLDDLDLTRQKLKVRFEKIHL